MSEICQTKFPEALRVGRALPGIAPLPTDFWIEIDEAYCGQLARRRALIETRSDKVLASCPGSEAAASETLAAALTLLKRQEGFRIGARSVLCPDGREVDLTDPPLKALGQLIQEDICLLEKPADAEEHVLTAACLCFPASWTLSEKIGRPLLGIHDPVDEYDATLGKRVQRLFDGVQVDRPLWRFNRLWYQEAELHQPRSENAPRQEVSGQERSFLRMEKQSLVRLPDTRAVVFSIHTFVLQRRNVPEEVISDLDCSVLDSGGA